MTSRQIQICVFMIAALALPSAVPRSTSSTLNATWAANRSTMRPASTTQPRSTPRSIRSAKRSSIRSIFPENGLPLPIRSAYPRAGGKISTGGGRTYELGDDLQGDMIGSAARLVWTGPTDRTLLEYSGFGWVIEDLTLIGYPRKTAADIKTELPRCRCGLAIRDEVLRVPSGKATFSITFIGFDIAVCCSSSRSKTIATT